MWHLIQRKGSRAGGRRSRCAAARTSALCSAEFKMRVSVLPRGLKETRALIRGLPYNTVVYTRPFDHVLCVSFEMGASSSFTHSIYYLYSLVKNIDRVVSTPETAQRRMAAETKISLLILATIILIVLAYKFPRRGVVRLKSRGCRKQKRGGRKKNNN